MKQKSKNSVSSPLDAERTSKNNLGLDGEFEVSTSPPRSKGSVVSPLNEREDSKSRLGISDESPSNKKKGKS